MAHTTAITLDTVEGVDSAVYAQLTFSGTYATGGETLTPGELGLAAVKLVQCEDVRATATTVVPAQYNVATGKVQIFDDAGVEVANGVSLTGFTLRIKAIGS